MLQKTYQKLLEYKAIIIEDGLHNRNFLIGIFSVSIILISTLIGIKTIFDELLALLDAGLAAWWFTQFWSSTERNRLIRKWKRNHQ